MLELIYGAPGSGKTELLENMIKEDLKSERSVLLIVPDQELVFAEASLSEKTEDIPSYRLGVYSFSRLCDLVFRKYGSLSYRSIDGTEGKLITFMALSSVLPALTEFGGVNISDSALISDIYQTVKQLKQYAVTPKALENASNDSGISEKLQRKLSDMSVILAAYDKVVSTGFDDPTDDLQKLCRIATEHPVFEGYSVYVDSFIGFTPVQYGVLERMIASAERTVITLGALPFSYGASDTVSPIHETEGKLLSIAKRLSSEVSKKVLEKQRRFSSNELLRLSSGLTGGEGLDTEELSGVRLVSCNTVYEEAAFVASDIASRVRQGARYRDFSITVRNMEAWRGILDAELDKYGVPCHISARVELCTTLPVRFLLSALNVCIRGFMPEDVKAYLKTGLTGVPIDAADMLEDYITRRKISSSRLLSVEPFTESPFGFGIAVTEDELMILDKINLAKDALISPLYDLSNALKDAHTAKDISRTLYSFLCSVGLWDEVERLKSDAERYGDGDFALRLDQIRAAMTRSMEKLTDIAKDAPLELSVYAELLKMVLSETDIGTIPSYSDAAVAGEAPTLRTGGVKHAYVIGLNEGEFPAPGSEGGIFKDADIAELALCGIELSGDSAKLAEREFYDFYRAVSSPSDTLTLTYHLCDLSGAEKRPSYAVERVKEVLSGCRAELPDPELLPIQNRVTALAAYARDPESDIGRAVEGAFLGDGELEALKRTIKTPIISRTEALSPETAEKLFPKRMKLTPSRLDRYSKCEFAFFCQYVLSLNDTDEIVFDAKDYGNFVHYIVKRLVDDCISDRSTVDIGDKELTLRISDYSAEYIRSTLGCDIDGIESGRVRAAFKRLVKAAKEPCKDILSELRCGEFFPAYTEVPIVSHKGKTGIPAFNLKLEDGSEAYLTGIIDRVDVMEKNGVRYIKLVDYKTGKTDFRPEKLSELEGIQLFLYMLSVVHPDGESTDVPAALYYMETVKGRTEDVGDGTFSDEPLRRSGAVLNDPEVLEGLEAGLDENGSERFSARVGHISFAVNDKFTEMFDSVVNSVSSAAYSMRSGSAHANADKGHDSPCKYCKFRRVCRNTDAGQ